MDTTNKLAEAERARFEQWMLTQGYGSLPIICSEGSPCAGEYANQYWHRSWVTWLAAKSDATQAVSEPVATQPAEAVVVAKMRSALEAARVHVKRDMGRAGRHVAFVCQATLDQIDEALAHPAPASASEPNDYAHTLLPRQLRSWAEPASDHSETIPRLMLAAADALERDCASASAAGAGEALREPMPDDILTVANIEPVDGGSVLTLLASDLGDLVDIVGEEDEHYLVHITGMKRADFEALGEFDGF